MKPQSTIYFVDDKALFIQVDKYPITPHLKLKLEYPSNSQVDNGAIKFVLGGANIIRQEFSKGKRTKNTSCKKIKQ